MCGLPVMGAERVLRVCLLFLNSRQWDPRVAGAQGSVQGAATCHGALGQPKIEVATLYGPLFPSALRSWGECAPAPTACGSRCA